MSSCAFADDFYGVVKKVDTSATPAYQATIKILEGGKPLPVLKTFADGSYKFPLTSDQRYTVAISYPNYLDTTFYFVTDKDAKPSAQNVVTQIRKNGMRLMGALRSQAENFPIRDAIVIVKNVMTRQEQRVTTGPDGAYIFRLDYETNYRISLDKRSPGIMNKYRDTAFYVSTIGFNQPLDYRLNIYLEEDWIKNTEGIEEYDPTNPWAKDHVKPMVDVLHKQFKMPVAVGKATADVPMPEPPPVPTPKPVEPQPQETSTKVTAPAGSPAAVKVVTDTATKAEVVKPVPVPEPAPAKPVVNEPVVETTRPVAKVIGPTRAKADTTVTPIPAAAPQVQAAMQQVANTTTEKPVVETKETKKEKRARLKAAKEEKVDTVLTAKKPKLDKPVASAPVVAEKVAPTPKLEVTQRDTQAAVKRVAELKADLKLAKDELEDLKKKEVELARISAQIAASTNTKTGKKETVEVVIIRDEPKGKQISTSEIARRKVVTENRIKRLEEEIAVRKKEGKKK